APPPAGARGQRVVRDLHALRAEVAVLRHLAHVRDREPRVARHEARGEREQGALPQPLGVPLQALRVAVGALALAVGFELLALRGLRVRFRSARVGARGEQAVRGAEHAGDQRGGDRDARGHVLAVPAQRLAQAVSGARWTGLERLVREVAPDLGGQFARSLVATVAVLFEALERDPVQLLAELRDQVVHRRAPQARDLARRLLA